MIGFIFILVQKMFIHLNIKTMPTTRHPQLVQKLDKIAIKVSHAEEATCMRSVGHWFAVVALAGTIPGGSITELLLVVMWFQKCLWITKECPKTL